MYRYGPALAASARKITGEKELTLMQDYCQDLYKKEKHHGAENHPDFEFVSGYIFAHVPIGLLSEQEAESVLSYVNENRYLFSES